jgi:hypothetical protein
VLGVLLGLVSRRGDGGLIREQRREVRHGAALTVNADGTLVHCLNAHAFTIAPAFLQRSDACDVVEEPRPGIVEGRVGQVPEREHPIVRGDGHAVAPTRALAEHEVEVRRVRACRVRLGERRHEPLILVAAEQRLAAPVDRHARTVDVARDIEVPRLSRRLIKNLLFERRSVGRELSPLGRHDRPA